MATAAKTGRKQPSIRTLWAIAKSPELGLTDDDLHAVVYRETGKDSIRKLSQGELTSVVRVLQNMKDGVKKNTRTKRTDEGGNPRTVEQRRKIYALCEELGWNNDPRRIQAKATLEREPTKKVNLNGGSDQSSSSGETESSGSGSKKGVNIQKFIMQVDLKKIKDLQTLLALLQEIEDYTNGNGDEDPSGDSDAVPAPA